MKTPSELEPVTVLLPAETRAALRREACRRVDIGEANRIDVSALVREAIAAWFDEEELERRREESRVEEMTQAIVNRGGEK